MESNESSDSAILVDWRKSAAGTNGRRRSTSTSVWTSGIVLAVVLVCTTLLAFSSPAKILTNPMGRSHTWLPSFHTPNNNDNDPDPRHEQPSLTVFSFIFPSSDNNTNASNSEKRNTSDNLIGDQNRAKESNATATTGPINSGDQGPKALSSAKNISDALKSTRGVGFVWKRQCDIFDGRWMPVRDESYPYYPAGTCPYIDQSFDCFRNGRPDKHYEKWRWQPNECSMPRLNASDMLERLRGKRLVLVGDSLNRNMWESLVCILRHSLKHKNRVYEVSGRHEFKTEGFYSFRFQDYNCSVDFVRSPFLVQEWQMHDGNGTTKETLRLDIIESSSSKYIDADIIVFNTGHWWTHEKTSKGRDYYQEGDHVYSELNVIEAYRKALETWARWVDANINPNKTQVFFRGYSASHFSGGQWNSGGKCHTETQPIFNMSYLIRYPPKMNVLESIVHKMKTPVVYLNITRMTDYRKDGHPSVYGNQYTRHEDRMAPDRYQDCSHWCLPGVPDAWNELLYASLLMKGLREWAT